MTFYHIHDHKANDVACITAPIRSSSWWAVIGLFVVSGKKSRKKPDKYSKLFTKYVVYINFFFLFFFYKYCPTLVDYCAVGNARLSLPKLAISCWTTLRQTLSGKKVLFQLYSFSNSAIASRLLANRWTKCDFWFKKTLRLLSRFLCF